MVYNVLDIYRVFKETVAENRDLIEQAVSSAPFASRPNANG